MNEEYVSKYLTGQDIDNALDKATTAVQPEELDEIKEDLSELTNLFPKGDYPIAFTNNTVSNGIIGAENPKRLVSELLDLVEGDTFSIASGYRYTIFRYSKDGNYLSNPVAWTEGSDGTYTCTSVYANYKHRIYIAADDNSDISISDIVFMFNFENYPDVPLPISEAISNAVNPLSGAINEIVNVLPEIVNVLPKDNYLFTFENKTFSSSTGQIGDYSPNRLISELIETHEGDSFTIASGFEFEVFRFDMNGNYISNPVAWTNATSFTFTSSSEAYNRYKHRIYARKTNNADCTQADLGFQGNFENYQGEDLKNIEQVIDEKISSISFTEIDDNEISIEKTWSSSKIKSEIPVSESMEIVDINLLSMWENGNIIVASGEPAPDTSWLFPVSIRTKNFVVSDVYYVAVDKGWFIRVFEYNNEGIFTRWITGDNLASAFLSPKMKYKIQLIKEGADPNKQSTHISIADESYTHVHFFKVKGAPSEWYKYINFGAFKYPEYYSGQQTEYNLDKDITYTQLISKWDELVTGRTSYITKSDLGEASDNQHLYLYDLNPTQISLDAHSALIASSAKAVANIPKIIVTVCQHGNERDAAFGAYYFVKDLLENWDKNEMLNYIRHHVRLLIIPCCNPYGWDNRLGVNANGVNTNRNFDYLWQPSTVPPFNQEYGGLAPFDQPESQIIRDLVYLHADAFHLCDFHTTGNVAPQVNEVAWLSYHETNDVFYNRTVHCASYLMKEFSAQMIKRYNLNYDEETLLGWMIGGQGSGVLKNWASEQKIIGTTLETTGEIYGMTDYHTPRAMKYSSELFGNWLGTIINEYNKVT